MGKNKFTDNKAMNAFFCLRINFIRLVYFASILKANLLRITFKHFDIVGQLFVIDRFNRYLGRL